MTRSSEPFRFTRLVAQSDALHGAVRRAVYPTRRWLVAGVIAAGFAEVIPLAVAAAPFPAVFPLARLPRGDGSAGFVLSGIGTQDRSGRSVSAAGDINGDGIDDLIIGAPNADLGGHWFAGESYVVLGSTQGFPAVLPLARLFPADGGDGSEGFVLAGIDANDRSGYSVSAAGDVNGDRIDDLIVGAFEASPGGHFEAGESYVVFGRSSAP